MLEEKGSFCGCEVYFEPFKELMATIVKGVINASGKVSIWLHHYARNLD